MKPCQLLLPDEAATARLAETVARFAHPGWVVFLEGELAAGKTFFARAFLRALGHAGAVKSPTFTVVETYDTPAGPVHHFDLYRINDPDELHYLGFDDTLAAEAICLIEWPSRARGVLPAAEVVIFLSHIDVKVRSCVIQTASLQLQKALEEQAEISRTSRS